MVSWVKRSASTWILMGIPLEHATGNCTEAAEESHGQCERPRKEDPVRDDVILRKVDDAPICIQVTPQAS